MPKSDAFPPPLSLTLARNYSQRPKSDFSPQARQLLFDFTTTRTTCERREEAQDGEIEVFTGFDPESGS